jgi:urease accessory protein
MNTTTTPRLLRGLVVVLLCCAAPWAFAHGGHAGDHSAFMAGLLHPFTGFDHWLALLAVGLWSAVAIRPVGLAPSVFTALLALGALAGFAGVQAPGLEPMLAASVLVLGLLLARAQALSATAVCLLVGAFAAFHGLAHGAELGTTGQGPALAGLLLSSAVLQGVGVLVGRRVLISRIGLRQAGGGAVALLGSALLLGLV